MVVFKLLYSLTLVKKIGVISGFYCDISSSSNLYNGLQNGADFNTDQRCVDSLYPN